MKRFNSISKKYGVWLILVLLVLIVSILQPLFLQPKNLTNVLKQVAVNGILSIGMSFVIILGEIDLTVGSVFCFCGMAMMKLMPMIGWFPSIIVGLVSGILIGAFCGYFVDRGIPSFIMTLAVQIILRGFANMISNGTPISSSSDAYNAIGQDYFLGIPVQVYIYLILAFIAIFVMLRTKFGRSVYAVGGNSEVARLSGINVRKIRIITFMISGLLAAMAAVVGTARLGSCEPTLGSGYESDAIAATVIGGVAMSGGEGSQAKTICGVLILGVLNNMLNLLSVSPYWQYVFKGGIIILAVSLDIFRRKNR